MKRFLHICILLFLAESIAMAAVKVEISGRVVLGEKGGSSPADYVMIYAKEYGVGTLSDEDGNYNLSVITSASSIHLEYSRIGYSVVDTTIVLTPPVTTVEPVVLQSQPLMLMAAYITKDGRDPAQVVLSNLWARCRQIRKNPFDFRADVEYRVATHEIPLVASALPKLATGAVKLFAGFQGYGPLVRYCLKNDDFQAHAKMFRQVKGGVSQDYNKTLVSSNKPLPSDVQRNVLDAFGMIDIFNTMYGDSAVWGEKFAKKHKFTLTGTYEYGDKLVDVLSCTDRRGKTTAVLHIVEESWAILKAQLITREGEVLRLEARDIGNGVYMPISLVVRPSVSVIHADEIPGVIQSLQNNSSLPKKSRERLIKILRDHEGRDFNPYISVSGNVRYKL